MLKIEVGKCYRDGKDNKVGPMFRHYGVYIETIGDGRSWRENGKSVDYDIPSLVAEWRDNPIRVEEEIVTTRIKRTKLVPGNYDQVGVSKGGTITVGAMKSAYDVRKTIAILSEIADGLEQMEREDNETSSS